MKAGRSVNHVSSARLLAASLLIFFHCAQLTKAAQSTPADPPCEHAGFASSVHDISIDQEADRAAIKTAEGMLFVWNAQRLSFTLSIKGKDIRPLGDSEHIFFNVDGRILQIQLASIRDFAPDAKERKLDNTSILAAHRDWESRFIEELLHSKIKVQSFNTKLASGSDASVWQFDMPDGMNSEIRKQLYLSIVSGDYVLLLNSGATAIISDDAGHKFLQDTIATLKISATPIDVKVLSETIRKGGTP